MLAATLAGPWACPVSRVPRKHIRSLAERRGQYSRRGGVEPWNPEDFLERRSKHLGSVSSGEWRKSSQTHSAPGPKSRNRLHGFDEPASLLGSTVGVLPKHGEPEREGRRRGKRRTGGGTRGSPRVPCKPATPSLAHGADSTGGAGSTDPGRAWNTALHTRSPAHSRLLSDAGAGGSPLAPARPVPAPSPPPSWPRDCLFRFCDGLLPRNTFQTFSSLWPQPSFGPVAIPRPVK